MRLNRLRQSILFSFFLCSGSVHGAEIRTLVMDFGGDKQLGRSAPSLPFLICSSGERSGPHPRVKLKHLTSGLARFTGWDRSLTSQGMGRPC